MGKTLPESIPLAPSIDPADLARQFELSGSSILNVIQMSSIRALAQEQPISQASLVEEIRKEYLKVGKSF
ncbi:MAG: hypothetical protein IPJ40_18285 [Saprospirales bacterium]|nr:hypothetical protein [Saprospirales bacterium]